MLFLSNAPRGQVCMDIINIIIHIVNVLYVHHQVKLYNTAKNTNHSSSQQRCEFAITTLGTQNSMWLGSSPQRHNLMLSFVPVFQINLRPDH